MFQEGEALRLHCIKTGTGTLCPSRHQNEYLVIATSRINDMNF